MPSELNHVRVALELLNAFRDDVARELATFGDRRLRQHEQTRRQYLRETLYQVDTGLYPDAGTDPRLWQLVNRAEIARFRLQAPGIAPLVRLRDRLIAEANKEPGPAAGTYRLKPGKRFGLQERDLLGGDTVELTAAQAVAFADAFDPV